MSTEQLQNVHYLLIDGAQCQGMALPSGLADHPQACRLYREFGEAAAEVGPWLLPATAQTLEAALACARTEQFRFAVSFLHAGDLEMAEVERHLHRLRYVVPVGGKGQRYFLRYADNRAFSVVWEALRPPQRQQLLGPLHAWSWLDLDGHRRVVTIPVRQPEPEPTDPVEPLRLRPEQFKRLLDAARVGELLALVVEYFPECVQDIVLQGRWAGASAANQWLTHQDIPAHPVRAAVAAVTIREGAANLDDPHFAVVVAQATLADDPTALLAWRRQSID